MTYDQVILQWASTGTDNVQFNLENPDPIAEYTLESIEGLGPPPIDVIIADKVFEGGVFLSKRPQNREIVMMIGFQPLYTLGSKTVAELRRKLYGLLTPRLGYVPTFNLVDTAAVLPKLTTAGYVKNMEPNIFSKDPQLQITMACLTPYFTHPQFTHATPASLNGLNPLPMTNAGDAPTGFDISVKLTANASFFSLTNTATGQVFRVDFSFLTNDIIRIDTIAGERMVSVTRGAVTTILLNMMTSTSSWLQLVGGLNNLTPSQITYQITALRFTSKVWGY